MKWVPIGDFDLKPNGLFYNKFDCKDANIKYS